MSQLFRAIVPYFGSAFVAFGMLRYISWRIGLDNQDVHGQEFNTRAEYLKSIGLELAETSSMSGKAARRGNRAANNQRSDFDNTIEMDTL